MSPVEPPSKGVETLLARLREEGVAAGEAEAAAIRAAAEAEAARILADAKAEADAYAASVRAAADNHRAAGEEALKTAMRDAVLSMKSGLMAQFEADVRRMVTAATADPDLLRAMVIELVGRARDAVGAGAGTAVILPAEAIRSAEIVEDPTSIRSGEATGFVLGLAREMMAEGVTLHAADDLQAGIRARVAGDDVELDLSDAAVASLILQHLQPRFRAVMEGVVR